jgi:hypothetical protein
MYSLNIKHCIQSGQNSFLGGKPKLPADLSIPICTICGSEQTFFFQIALPDDVIWSGHTLAMFLCTSCADEEFLIPTMLKGVLNGIVIPKEFLVEYQSNFRVLVFETKTAKIREEYIGKIKFGEIIISESESVGEFGRLGGNPDWILGDETPGIYNDDVGMSFIMQTTENFDYPIHQYAPKQLTINLFGEIEKSNWEYYRLFVANAIYIFGANDGDKLVYIIPQSD